MKDDQAHKLCSGWYEGGGGWGTLSRTANIMFSTFFSAIVSRESWLTQMTEPACVIQHIILSYIKG